MNCRERQHDIVLFLYDELSDHARNQLRVHMDDCVACQEFYENEKQLHFSLTDDFSTWEVPSDLLVESRRRLSEELDLIDQKRFRWRMPSMVVPFLRMRLLESAAFVSIGLAVGVYVMAQRPVPTPAPPQQSQATFIPQNATVSNLRITEADPTSGLIELVGEMVQPIHLRGSLEDESIRDLLFGALRSPSNPGVRLRAVELLSRNPRDASVKELLIGSLLSDENIGVRLQALEGLQAFAAEGDVRRALKYALENDENPGVRVKAIEALTPLTAEEAMDGIVRERVRNDPNSYVTMRALQFVGTGN